MDSLLEIGFVRVGEWRMSGGELELVLPTARNASPALYAFLSNRRVMYVGKTKRTLANRLYGYLKGGGTQRTNIRVRAKIIEELKIIDKVEILGFYEDTLKDMGRFALNLPAALEDDVIAKLKPVWNKAGVVDRAAANLGAGRTRKTIKELPPRLASTPESSVSSNPNFFVKIGKTYFNQGFFNVPVDYQRYFAKHGEEIKIELGDSLHSVNGKINRTVNATNAPRIMGGVELRDWIQSHVQQGKMLRVVVKSPDHIVISAT